MDDISKQVGRRIRELRKARGLSQEALGERSGHHFSYVGQVERGEKNVSLFNLQKIAEALDVAIHQLFIFSVDSENFVESEERIRQILNLLHKLDQDHIKRLHKAIEALYGD